MRESDAASIDELIAAFYATFDNREGRPIAAERLRACFAEGATITRVSAGHAERWNPDDFIAPREALLSGGVIVGFSEWEVGCRMFADGERIAARASSYAKSGIMDGVPFVGSGRKLFQLVKPHDRWLIASIVWEDADAGPDRATTNVDKDR